MNVLVKKRLVSRFGLWNYFSEGLEKYFKSLINFCCTGWLDCWVCAVCSKAVLCLSYHLGNLSTKCQAFWGIQTKNSPAVRGSSVLLGHFFVDEIKETWASGVQKSIDHVSICLFWICTHFWSIDSALAGHASGEMLRGTGWVCPHFWRRYGSPASQRSV